MKMLLNRNQKTSLKNGVMFLAIFLLHSCSGSLHTSSWVPPVSLPEAKDRIANLEKFPTVSISERQAETAQILLWMGQLEEASKKIKLAIRAEPQDAGYRLLAGRIEMQKKDYFQAIQKLKSALVLDANLLEGHYYLGLAFQGIGEFEKAKATFENAVEMEPFYFEAQLALAKLLIKLETSSEGLFQIATRLEKTLPLKPDSMEGTILLSKVYQAQDFHLKANLILEEWLQGHKMQDPVALQLAQLAFVSQENAKALQFLGQITKKDFAAKLLKIQIQAGGRPLAKITVQLADLERKYPNQTTLYLWWGKLLAGEGKWVESEKKFQKLLRIAPQSAKAYFELSQIYTYKEDDASATWYLEKALELAPASRELQLYAAKKHLKQGEPKRAEAALEKFDPHNPKALLLRGKIAQERGDYKTAESLFSQLAATHGSIEAEVALAELELLEKKPRQALLRLRGVLQLTGHNLEVKITYAKAEIQTGRPKAAARRLAAYQKTKNTQGRLQLVLAEAEAKQGNLKKAVQVLQVGLKLHPKDPELVQAYSLYLGILRRYREAIPLLEAMQKVKSRYDKLFYYRLAEFYYLAGQKSAFQKLPLN